MTVLRILVLATSGIAAAPVYQKPAKEILDVLHAPPSPEAILSPSRTHLLLATPVMYPPIAELARPMLRLAGLRIDPATNGPHVPSYFSAYSLIRVEDGSRVDVNVPRDARLSRPIWSHDGRFFAFTQTGPSSIELWISEASTGKARRLEGIAVNAAYGEPLAWMTDGHTLLVQTVPSGRGALPAAPSTPEGPRIQEAAGRRADVWTFQDLLTSAHDEDLFDYYATSQLALVDAASGRRTSVGKPAIYRAAEPSPDGGHLLVTRIRRPYSWLQPHTQFPMDVEIWDRAGALLRAIAKLPLADAVSMDGVRTGPRNVAWRPDEPATLAWREALDGGNPREKVPHRDRIVMLRAPFTGEPVELLRTEHRAMDVDWLEKGGLALVRDFDRTRRWQRTFLLNASRPGEAPRMLWSRNMLDRYKDPGAPVERTLSTGQRAIAASGNRILLRGNGATPQGDRPFFDRYDLSTGETSRLFHSAEGAFETVVAPLDDTGSRLLIRRESASEPPNYLVRSANGQARALTAYTDPTPQLRGIRKQVVMYKRADGVPLSFTLYLPPGYKDGSRLPTVIWAYPREHTGADTAGQVSGSPHRFTVMNGASHMFFLLAGYAILDDASMPVIGEHETVNNTYIDQIVIGAKAAIDKAVELGVTDRERVGIGGHSYGGFMTANLLAHSDLFRAGIARSGAYNRTLTPFGFQAERRTLWEAPDTYLKMSPFLHANKIKEPILLIHGEADNNAGTFPIQSERMYQAIRGNGGTVRYVTLPHESHGYRGRESVEHTLYEMVSWFEKHVKSASGPQSGDGF